MGALTLLWLGQTLWAAPIQEVRPGTSDYAKIVQSALPSLNKGPAIKVGSQLDVVRRSGEWALVFDRLNVFTTDRRRVEWACLLRKSGGDWKRVRSIISGMALRIIAKENPHLPGKFFAAPPLKLQ
jgi:hypothetical protein